MTIEEVLLYFKTGRKACMAIGITPQNFSFWKRNGHKIPYKQQLCFEKVTNGDLKAEYIPFYVKEGEEIYIKNYKGVSFTATVNKIYS